MSSHQATSRELKDELDEFRRLIGPFDPSSSLRGALEAKIETWASLCKRWPYLTPDERDRVLSRCRHAYFHLQEYKANRKISTDTLLPSCGAFRSLHACFGY